MFVNVKRLVVVCASRDAAKNHRRSFTMNPPSVPSKALFAMLVGRCCPGHGVVAVQAGFVIVSRNEPLNSLPPDFVTVLTTPPVRRPYSAEIAPLITTTS